MRNQRVLVISRMLTARLADAQAGCLSEPCFLEFMNRLPEIGPEDKN